MSGDNSNGDEPDLLRLTADVAAAYVSNNSVSAADLLAIIRSIHGALQGMAGDGSSPLAPKPAVPIKRSVYPDHIVCLEDGAKLKMLKRYLRTHYRMSPEEYRQKWGLPLDYPMVAPDYAEMRSEFAKKIGLGKSLGSARRKSRRATG